MALLIGRIPLNLGVGINAPLCHKGLVIALGGGELQVTDFLGDDGTFVLRLQSGHQLGGITTSLLGVQVADLFGNIQQVVNFLVVALRLSLFHSATLTAHFDGLLLTLSVANKLARGLFNVLGCAGRFIEGSALFRSLFLALLPPGGHTVTSTIGGLSISWLSLRGLVTHFPKRSQALLNSLFGGHLPEGDLTLFLKVLLTNFFLGWLELRHIGVMALFNILVFALKDGLFLKGSDLGLFGHTAHSIVLGFTTAKVHPSRNGHILGILSASASPLATVVTSKPWVVFQVISVVAEVAVMVGCHKGSGQAEGQKKL